MSTKVTRDVLDAHLNCKYKGHLKLAGEHGTRSDYEGLLLERRDEVRLRASDKILARHQEAEVARNIPLTAATLKKGPLFVLDATLEEDDLVSLHFDGLKKVEGASKLGDFHYVPVLFHEGNKVRKEQKLMLEIQALLLSRVQGKMPGSGVVWNGKECKATRVRLGTDPRKAEKVLRDLQQMGDAGPPRLVLNDHCQVCEFRQRCHAQAVQEDNLSLLRGMGEKEVKGLARKGILTLTQLAHTFRPRRKGKRAVPKTHHRYHALQALAVRDRRVYVFGTPQLRDSPVKVYLDVEGVPDEGFDYLIGMVIVEGGTEKRFSFWAEDAAQEQEMFERFLAEVSRYDDFLVFCYGSYERTFLKRMRKAARRKKPVDRVLDRLVNILSLVHAHLYFPTYSNGLKDVAGCLGCSWTEPDASGLQSMVWRARWEAGHAEEWKQKLLTYNLEDCAALKKVTELIYSVGSGMASDGAAAPDRADGPPIDRVQDIARWNNNRSWEKINFANPDFEHINNCAYFDYQRERVYVRSSRTLRKSRQGQKKGRQRLRATHRVMVTSPKCPRCGSTSLSTKIDRRETTCLIPRVKRAFDLRVTPAGIRRKVIECRTSVHRCLGCGHDFVPEAHERLDKHFHGLKSWAMYQHVAHRLSLKSIQTMIAEFFGLRVHFCEIFLFKSLMARYYRPTYRALLRKLLAGPLIHIDETEVKLQTGKGYVWVFTNLEEVVFLYRPTREGGFLKEMLQDFHGVVVSDFYATYDSLDCPQQKCLIHLIRDMNQDLLNNPYDEEIRAITGPFGTLLRAAVVTIDEHGLKRRHLTKHAAEVEVFFRRLSEGEFRSETAEALRTRLLKYRDKLFTFIEHDDVPWNNNNAEYAVKRFAYYRENTVGMMKEGGLDHYLILLSVCETCRYKGVSFLRFLLSGSRDMEAFCRRKNLRRRFPAAQVYPKGYVPPHLSRLHQARSRHEGPAAGEATQEQT